MPSHATAHDAGIPVIDISKPSDNVAQEVLDAASTHGFLFIKNDGVTIPPADIEGMFNLSEQFFQKPKEEKSEFSIHTEKAGGVNRGWVTMQGESLDPEGQKQGDPKEAFNIGPPKHDNSLQPLPDPLASSTDLILRFQHSCHTLCTRILDLLGKALAIPDPTWFTTRHDHSRGSSGTIFRMLYYPQTGPSSKNQEVGTSIRAGAHSDYGSLTLLFRLPGQPGLEVLTPKNSWAPVPVNPSPDLLVDPPILVNIGDLLSLWTNGMLKSTVHRVTFSGGEERYSMAYFFHPLDDAELEPVPSKVIEGYGDRGSEELKAQREKVGLRSATENSEALTAKQHLDRRLKVTYDL